MKKLILTLALVLGGAAPAFATWSVIAIDAKTGQVIIASATCVRQQGFPERKPNGARDLMDVQAVIVPGRRRRRLPGRRRQHARKPDARLQRDQEGHAAGRHHRDAEEGSERRAPAVRHRLDSQRRARSRAQNNRAGFNGSGNSRSSLYFGGRVGDYLLPGAGQHAARRSGRAPGGARVHARQRHAGRSRDGGDGSGRRQRRRSPLQLRQQPRSELVPCDNKTAHVAYIAIANKDDQAGVTHNDGKYFAYITAYDNEHQEG